MATKQDNFLRDELAEKPVGTKFADGFRFGFGFFVAWLLGTVVVSGLAVAIAYAFHIR